jgi:hypothetical protein
VRHGSRRRDRRLSSRWVWGWTAYILGTLYTNYGSPACVLRVVHKEEPPSRVFRVNWKEILGRSLVALIIAITQVLVRDVDKQGTNAIQAPEGYGDFLQGIL